MGEGQHEQVTSGELFRFTDPTGQSSQHSGAPVWVQEEGFKARCIPALLGARVGMISGSQVAVWRKALRGLSPP